MWRRIFLCVMLVWPAGHADAQMLAEIRSDVETPFETYHPYPVAVQPAIPPTVVAADFSNVVNRHQFQLAETERQLLQQQQFVVTPATDPSGTGFQEMYDIYNDSRARGIPILVTTDAVLHAFHQIFGRILQICETQRLMGTLDALLSAMYDQALAQHSAASTPQAQAAALQTVEFLNVARALLDSTFVPAVTTGLAQQELALIRQHSGATLSPIFQYDEDYSQYQVRGHYTRSDSLRRYFLAMMWLGRMTFSRDDDRATLAALLLTQALTSIQVSAESATGLQVWNSIYQPTVFFVGKSDDITPPTYLHLAQQVYGDRFAELPPDSLTEAGNFNAFKNLVQQLPGPEIHAPMNPGGFSIAGMRFMGQRFIPDSYILGSLVYAQIPDMRGLPTGLDVMAVLGSTRARELLQQTPDWQQFPSYPPKLDSLAQQFAQLPEATWAQNLYWNWLYVLMPLLAPKGPGYPQWMQSTAWRDKDLFAALGSWAELRHDTILYSKASATTGGVAEVIGQQGYVEPNPHLYARLASLAAFLKTSLARWQLLSPEITAVIDLLHDTLLQLETISEKELENRPLSVEDYQLILDFGKTLERIADFAADADQPFEDKSAMPVIADVHTDAVISGQILHEAVGYPYNVVAVCRIEGQLVLARGAGFSYYEVTTAYPNRLTDEAWREWLQSETPPQPPAWSASFLPAQQWLNPKPEHASFEGFNVNIPWTRLDQDTVVLGGTLQAEIAFPKALERQGELRVWVESHAGTQHAAQSIVRESDSLCRATLATAGLEPGAAWVVVQAPAPPYSVGGDSLMQYRAGFFIANPTAIASAAGKPLPRDFRLLPAWPNPFNAGTTIAFDLPEKATVRLIIFDSRGRQVRSLIREQEMAPGRHRVVWQGKDDAGKAVSSGVYFVHLVANGQGQVQKIALVK